MTESSAPVMNVRHDLDPEEVKKQIEYKVKHLREFYANAKRDDPEFLAGTEQSVKQQENYYSKVRVIELPQRGHRFILVYGDVDDATVTFGTGPFETLEIAKNWFLTGSR